VLPRDLYLVTLENGKEARAQLSASARHAIVRLLVGDRVELVLSARDPGRGRIERKL
jgi:translation initiation factor IF-1